MELNISNYGDVGHVSMLITGMAISKWITIKKGLNRKVGIELQMYIIGDTLVTRFNACGFERAPSDAALFRYPLGEEFSASL